MKFLEFLLKNLMRNRRRTLLTVSCIAVSLFLVATLRTVLTELQSSADTPESALRLVTRHRVSIAAFLPISYRDRIAQVEGVRAVIASVWFGGVYRDPKDYFPQFAVNTDQFFLINADMRIPEDQKEAFLADRTGAIAGDTLVERFGWKIGDKIHLQGAIFMFNPELTLRGVYRGGADGGSSLYFHYDYFDEGTNRRGRTIMFSILARSAEEVPAVAERVDSLFRDSTAPTRTESEKAFVLNFLSMVGNVRLLINAICGVVILTIVLVASNSMAMSIRERVREVGIMKVLGFRKVRILSLLVGESSLLGLSGALIGVYGARAIFSRVRISSITAGFVQRFYVDNGTVLICVAIGIFVGAVAAAVPAWLVARKPIADALRSAE
jgi:putative ABC transport system permease protein